MTLAETYTAQIIALNHAISQDLERVSCAIDVGSCNGPQSHHFSPQAFLRVQTRVQRLSNGMLNFTVAFVDRTQYVLATPIFTTNHSTYRGEIPLNVTATLLQKSATSQPTFYSAAAMGVKPGNLFESRDIAALQWVPASGSYNWGDANTYCANLGSSWRLPTFWEFKGLDSQRDAWSGLLDPQSWYWTSTPDPTTTGNIMLYLLDSNFASNNNRGVHLTCVQLAPAPTPIQRSASPSPIESPQPDICAKCGSACLKIGASCCDEAAGKYCVEGTKCCGQSSCIPVEASCCDYNTVTGWYCPRGTRCQGKGVEQWCLLDGSTISSVQTGDRPVTSSASSTLSFYGLAALLCMIPVYL
eukprot:PhF_6_TR34260/c0_g1_i1/m.50248